MACKSWRSTSDPAKMESSTRELHAAGRGTPSGPVAARPHAASLEPARVASLTTHGSRKGARHSLALVARTCGGAQCEVHARARRGWERAHRSSAMKDMSGVDDSLLTQEVLAGLPMQKVVAGSPRASGVARPSSLLDSTLERTVSEGIASSIRAAVDAASKDASAGSGAHRVR